MDIHGDEAIYGQVSYPVAYAPTLPYPTLPAGIRRFVGREDTQSPLPPYAWRQFIAHGDSSSPSHGDEALYGQVPYPVAFAP